MQFQAFQSIVAVEAFSREAVMMSALQEFGGQGLKNLTPGDLYGSAKHWSKPARLSRPETDPTMDFFATRA